MKRNRMKRKYAVLIPMVLSAVMLGEARLLGIKHLIALALIAAGIISVNLKPQQRK